MTMFKIVSVAVLSMAIVTPVFAQAAIQEPGAFAFYHPDADVLNGGRPASAAGTMGTMASVPFGGSSAYASMEGGAGALSCTRRYHSFDPGSGTFLGRDRQRHPCR
jgi:hypothetical protein